jgi:hypothetical protein
MASNLECVGLPVVDGAGLADLVKRVLPRARSIGRSGEVDVLRWEDPSGARLVLGIERGELVDLLPSFRGHAGVNLAAVTRANTEVAIAAVVDDAGEQLSAMAVELEQRRFLPATGDPVSGRVSVVALARSVQIHADEASFSASDASLLDAESAASDPPAPEGTARERRGPARWAAESFVSFGAFDDGPDAEATAWLAGTVLRSERRTVVATGEQFVTARVRTVGGEIDVCLAGSEVPVDPAPGQIIAGHVFLSASMPTLEPAATGTRRSSWWRRNR